MIGQLRGRLAGKRPNQVLVDVGGVGYLVQVPLSTYAALGELHTEVTLLIHTHVREDALALYGFVSAREKHFFEMLLSASGVGPALVNLGYDARAAEGAVGEAKREAGAGNFEKLLRAALQSLSAPKGRSARGTA